MQQKPARESPAAKSGRKLLFMSDPPSFVIDSISVLSYQCAKEDESLHKKARSKRERAFLCIVTCVAAAAAAEAAGAGFDNGAGYGCAQSSGLYTTRSE